MAYDERLAKRLTAILSKRDDFHEQKMFGGIGYLMRGNMCIGIWKDSLILRLGKIQAQKALKRKDVKPFDITGRAMQGWAMVTPNGIKSDIALKRWVLKSIHFVSQLPHK